MDPAAVLALDATDKPGLDGLWGETEPQHPVELNYGPSSEPDACKANASSAPPSLPVFRFDDLMRF